MRLINVVVLKQIGGKYSLENHRLNPDHVVSVFEDTQLEKDIGLIKESLPELASDHKFSRVITVNSGGSFAVVEDIDFLTKKLASTNLLKG